MLMLERSFLFLGIRLWLTAEHHDNKTLIFCAETDDKQKGKIMTRVQLLVLSLCAIALSGCYSIARYEANVRPATVKPSAAVTGKYRLERILLHKNALIGISKDEYVEGRLWFEASGAFRTNKTLKNSYADKAKTAIKPDELLKKIEDPKSFDAFVRDYNKAFPFLYSAIIQMSQNYHVAVETNDVEGKAKIMKDIVDGYCDNWACKLFADDYKKTNNAFTHESSLGSVYSSSTKLNKSKACNKIFFDAVQASLLKNYPNVFTTSGDATPVTVLVTFENKFEDHHNLALILAIFGSPFSQELEVTYRIRVLPGAQGQSQDELWKEYVASQLDYPPNAQNSSTVRVRNMWTSMMLPISLLGMPGDSDWPKRRKVFTMGSFGITKQNHELDIAWTSPQEYLQKYIFDSVCDGDIIAALIMRSLNKMAASK